MRLTQIAAFALAVAVACQPCAAQPATGQAQLEEIRAFETRYLQTVDAGNVKAQLELVSHDPAVYSILDGEVWHGWDAVKAQAEAFVPFSQLVRSVVDTLEIVPLGRDAALVVMLIHSERKGPADKTLVLDFPDRTTGVLSHVLVRTTAGWLVLHEHWSTKLTPEVIAFKSALLELQRKAAEKKKPATRE